MSRTERKTRIRGLPGRVFLTQADAKSGSFPSIARTSSDNRTGKYIVFFDDTSTINFVSTSMFPGPGVTQAIAQKDTFQDFGDDIEQYVTSSTAISASGRLVKGIADRFVSFTPGQAWEPYKELYKPEAENKATVISNSFSQPYNIIHSKSVEFYHTGSDPKIFGEGFQEPLWSKTKFTIDLSPSVEHSVSIQNNIGVNENFPMMYWNKDAKRYEGVGRGFEFSRYSASLNLNEMTQTLNRFLEEQLIGFGPSMDLGFQNSQDPTSAVAAWNSDAGVSYDEFDGIIWDQHGVPITTFGFPFHQKFHATSSNLVAMSDYISEPFLVEKIVLEISCAMKLNKAISGPNRFNNDTTIAPDGTNSRILSTVDMSTFFILNQRRPVSRRLHHPIQFVTKSRDPADASTTTLNSKTFPVILSPSQSVNGDILDTTRDLLSYGQIVGLNSSGSGANKFFVTASKPGVTRLFENHEAFIFRDDTPTSAGGSGVNWQGKFRVEMKPKSFFKNFGLVNRMQLDVSGSFPFLGNPDPGSVACLFRIGIDENSRDGLNISTAKSLLNPSAQLTEVSKSTFFYEEGPSFTTSPAVTLKRGIHYSKDNPYFLLPTDKLIFGWQVPLGPAGFHRIHLFGSSSIDAYEGNGPELVFPVSPSKIIFYGSSVKQGKETHDTLNQLLTSNTVHEVIE